MEAKLRELTLRNAILIGLGLAGFYYFFLYDAPDIKQQVQSKKNQIQTLEKEVSNLDKQILAAENAEEELAQTKEEIESRAKRFSMNLQPETIQQIISEEARAAGIFFESIGNNSTQRRSSFTSQMAPEGAPSFSIEDYIMQLSIGTNFKGTFSQVMRFLSYLTRTDQVISLKSLEIKSQLSDNDLTNTQSPVLNFNADFEAYSLLKDLTAETLRPESKANTNQGGM